MRGFVLGVLVATVLILGVARWRSASPTDDRQPDPPVTDTAEAWEGAPRDSSSFRPTPHGISQPLPLNATEAHARIQAKRAQERKNIDRIAAAGRSKLVGRYGSEPIDHAWATAKRTELMGFGTSEQIEAIQAQPSNLDVNCRSSVCRIGADFPNRSAADDWAILYLTGVGGSLPRASLQTSVNPDGSIHLDLYGFARP